MMRVKGFRGGDYLVVAKGRLAKDSTVFDNFVDMAQFLAGMEITLDTQAVANIIKEITHAEEIQ